MVINKFLPLIIAIFFTLMLFATFFYQQSQISQLRQQLSTPAWDSNPAFLPTATVSPLPNISFTQDVPE